MNERKEPWIEGINLVVYWKHMICIQEKGYILASLSLEKSIR